MGLKVKKISKKL